MRSGTSVLGPERHVSWTAAISIFTKKSPVIAPGFLLRTLPVDQPIYYFMFVISLKSAKALGLTVRPTLLAITDDVIE